ncbi:unnamed protein product [Natator depressus]
MGIVGGGNSPPLQASGQRRQEERCHTWLLPQVFQIRGLLPLGQFLTLPLRCWQSEPRGAFEAEDCKCDVLPPFRPSRPWKESLSDLDLQSLTLLSRGCGYLQCSNGRTVTAANGFLHK